jgi:hypothetical protein
MASFNVDSISYVQVSIGEFNDAYVEVGIVVAYTAKGGY